ncbi:hypothetical protein [Nocardioides sp.]|uniref:hypothetical protein n=1 Tax=Nocardioides sp. TaxID=35761 RepID=UPI002ED362DD
MWEDIMARVRARDVVIALAAALLGLTLVVPASAVAAESDQPALPPPSDTAPESPPDVPLEEPVTEPTEPVDAEPTEPAEEPSSEDPLSEAPTRTEEPSPTDESTPVDEPQPAQDQAVLAATQQLLAADDFVFADKVLICHRTNDPTNPYNQQSPSFPQVEGHALNHTGPIFTPGGPRPWGDIIPPNPAVPNGKNWPAGESILANGCEVEPHPGPLPSATIGQLVCTGIDPSIEVRVSNDSKATAPASFTILVNNTAVQTAGPVAPGGSQTVTLTADDLGSLEDETVTITVRSGGSVVASSVVTIDCAPPPPGVHLVAQLDCGPDGAVGSLEVTNNGPDPVTVSVRVNGADFADQLVVGSGATETGTADFSQFEDQTITVEVLVDDVVVATYLPTPDCENAPVPRVAIGSLQCPTATATLSNAGDPESTVVFTILVNGEVYQESAPLFGGDTTTIVGDLRPYEDQTITIALRANGELLGSRTIHVDCREAPGTGPGAGQAPGAGQDGPATVPTVVAAGTAPPATGTPLSLWMLSLALGLLACSASVLLHVRRGREQDRLS